MGEKIAEFILNIPGSFVVALPFIAGVALMGIFSGELSFLQIMMGFLALILLLIAASYPIGSLWRYVRNHTRHKPQI